MCLICSGTLTVLLVVYRCFSAFFATDSICLLSVAHFGHGGPGLRMLRALGRSRWGIFVGPMDVFFCSFWGDQSAKDLGYICWCCLDGFGMVLLMFLFCQDALIDDCSDMFGLICFFVHERLGSSWFQWLYEVVAWWISWKGSWPGATSGRSAHGLEGLLGMCAGWHEPLEGKTVLSTVLDDFGFVSCNLKAHYLVINWWTLAHDRCNAGTGLNKHDKPW